MKTVRRNPLPIIIIKKTNCVYKTNTVQICFLIYYSKLQVNCMHVIKCSANRTQISLSHFPTAIVKQEIKRERERGGNIVRGED